MLGLSTILFNADYVILDTGNVRSIVDWKDPTHVLDQPTAGLQVAAPVGHADYLGRLCFDFTAGGKYYVDNAAASRWAFSVDGTGFSLFAVVTPTNVGAAGYMLCRTNEADTTCGFGLYVQSSNFRSNARNASSLSLWSDRAQGAAAAGTATFVEISHGTSRSPQFDLRLKSATISSGSYANAASAGNPTSTFVLGSRPSGAADKFQGRVREIIATPGVSAAERSLVHQYIGTYGIAA